MQKNHKLISFQAFAMYFLTGAACLLVGSSMPHLVKQYNMALGQVVLLGSAYALGRVSTVYITGKMVEKLGPKKVLAIGVILIGLFFFGISTIVNYYAGLAFAFLGGAGMGAQDTVCPLLLSKVFKKNYAGALSAGQALFGLGGFSTPFLIGVILSKNLPFYFAYYILLIVPIVMLVMLPFMKWDDEQDKSNNSDSEQEKQVPSEQIKPLYAKHKIAVYGALFAVCAGYSAIVNAISLYTSSFAESLGIPSSTAAFMLTVYNIGCFVGSIVFIFVLRKVKAQKILQVNLICAFVAIAISLFINKSIAYFICLFIAGFFLGVLFSVIVAIATRIGHERISVAGSYVATASGLSDILTPVVTGFLVSRLGVDISFYYAALMIIISLIAAIILNFNTTEHKPKIESPNQSIT